MGEKFKPSVVSSNTIVSEKGSEEKEKFLDWHPFDADVIDISFTSIEGSRNFVNNKIKNLQIRLNKYLNTLHIPNTDFDDRFNLLMKNTDTNIALQQLSELVSDITSVLRKQLPEAEKIERSEWIESFDLKLVNQLVAYNEPDYFSSQILNIHILPNRTTVFKDKLKLLKEGFQGIAQIVDLDPKIKKIVGDSWIGVDHPELIKKLGFKVDNNLKEEFQRIFIDKTKKKSDVMYINREEFLKKYLTK